MIYRDRFDAGRQLAEALEAFADHPDVLVLALPRGGVPVGFAIAQALHVPLDVLMVRKLGVPGREELAMGALASGGVRLLNDEIIAALEVTPEEIDAVVHAEQVELERREQLYRAGRVVRYLRRTAPRGRRRDLHTHARTVLRGRHVVQQLFPDE